MASPRGAPIKQPGALARLGRTYDGLQLGELLGFGIVTASSEIARPAGALGTRSLAKACFPVGHWWDTEPQKWGDGESKRQQLST